MSFSNWVLNSLKLQDLVGLQKRSLKIYIFPNLGELKRPRRDFQSNGICGVSEPAFHVAWDALGLCPNVSSWVFATSWSSDPSTCRTFASLIQFDSKCVCIVVVIWFVLVYITVSFLFFFSSLLLFLSSSLRSFLPGFVPDFL